MAEAGVEEDQTPVVLFHVPCPARTVPEYVHSKNEALCLFKRLCPPSMKIIDIFPMQSRGKYACIWRVMYVHRDKDNPQDMDELLLQFRIRQPQNAKITLKNFLYSPEVWLLHYSIIGCRCPSGFDLIPMLRLESINSKPMTSEI